MEITNEERRRVAKKLLEIIWCMRKREEFYKSDVDPIRCGNVTYRNVAGSVEESGNLIKGNYINIVERLADLIDRPTCRNVSGHQDVFECSECKFRAEVVCEEGNEYGDIFSTPFMPHFCPNCDAEVVE